MRPILFAACERVIVDANGLGVTLVQVIEVINLNVRNMNVPPEALANVRWHSFVMWMRDDAPDVQYEQSISVLNPAGSLVFPTVSTTFKFDSSTHRAINFFEAFPAAAGLYDLQLSIKPVGPDHPQLVGHYPIRVAHNAHTPMAPGVAMA